MLARLMVGAASRAAGRVSVVIGAISQFFGGLCQDRPAFAETTSVGTENGCFRPCPANPKDRHP